jgi:urease accessory protein
LLIANKLIPQGQGLSPVLLRRAATVALDWDTRQRSRFEMMDSDGRRVAAVLPRGAIVRGGDVLVVEDGSLVRVIAARQALLVVHARRHGDPFDLMRAAYHLGNRHVSLELQADHLKIEPDHVLAQMLEQMQLAVHPIDAPFEPESGAYAIGNSHHHSHRHSHRHLGGPEHVQA